MITLHLWKENESLHNYYEHYSQSPVICEEFIKSILGSTPKYITVTISRKPFKGSKLMKLCRPFAMTLPKYYRWIDEEARTNPFWSRMHSILGDLNCTEKVYYKIEES